MSGRKRSRDEGYDSLMKKIRKLEKKVKRKYRSDSEGSEISNLDGDAQSYDCIPVDDYDDEIQPDTIQLEDLVPTPDQPLTPIIAQQSATLLATDPQAASTSDNVIPREDNDNDLDQTILCILGDDPTLEKSYGDNLHKDIATRWKHILLNGLNKENRLELLKKYLPSENCINMQAPKLNPEIKAALTDVNNKKDIYSQSRQNQLTSCLSALGKALNIVLSNKTIPHEILTPISDASRLICDYHHKESLSRRYAAMNSLNKETKDIIKNTKIDEFLFGSNLAEQLKSSKAISKSGVEMRTIAGPSGIKNKPTISQPPAIKRNMTLNLRGAPRTTAAEPRVNPTPRRQPAQHRHAPNSRPSQRHRARRP